MPKGRRYQGVVAVRLPPETDGELRQLVHMTRMTQSELLRRLLRQAVRQALSLQRQEAGTMT